MGVYSEIIIRCYCGNQMSIQIKGGKCNTYYENNLTKEQVEDINKEQILCEKCGNEYLINIEPELIYNLKLEQIIERSNWKRN